MDVQIFRDPREFVAVANDFLAADPFSTTIIGVRAYGVLTGINPLADDDLWAAVLDRGVVVGVAMCTPPHPLVLSRMPAAAAAELSLALSRIGPLLGANGETAAVRAFVDAWPDRPGTVVDVSLRLYRLGALRLPAASGTAHLASSADQALVRDWLVAFDDEAMPRHPIRDLDDLVRHRIAAGQMWLWFDGTEPVSLAAVSAPAHGVSRVGPVYTPPQFRRHGYGAAVTAHASQAALQAGAQHVVLYTDLANRTSNKIYQSIGYLPDHDFEEHHFVG